MDPKEELEIIRAFESEFEWADNLQYVDDIVFKEYTNTNDSKNIESIYEDELQRIAQEYQDIYGYPPPASWYSFNAGRVVLIKIVVAKQFPHFVKLKKYIEDWGAAGDKIIKVVEDVKKFIELSPAEQLEAARQTLGKNATKEQMNEWINKMNTSTAVAEDEEPAAEQKAEVAEQPRPSDLEEPAAEEEPMEEDLDAADLDDVEIEVYNYDGLVVANDATGGAAGRPTTVPNRVEPIAEDLVEEPEITIVDEIPASEIFREEEIDVELKDQIDAFELSFSNKLQGAADIELTDVQIRTMYNESFKEAFGSEVSDTLVLATDEIALSISGVFNTILTIAGIVLLAFMIGKRLMQSWRDGGILVPYQAPFFCFDVSNISKERLDSLHGNDFATLYSQHDMKHHPQKYIAAKLKEFLRHNRFKENENFKIRSETRFIAYKRDPRLDDDWDTSSVEKKTVDAIYNEYPGWIFWVWDFNNNPINYYQMTRLYFNVALAQANMFGWSHLKETETHNAANLLRTDDYAARQMLQPEVDGWDAQLSDISWSQHLKNIEKYIPGSVWSADTYKTVEYNSGVNITLVGYSVAAFRQMLGFPIRTEDFWYLLPDIAWEKDSDDVYSLKSLFAQRYGERSVRLTNDSKKLPIAVGEDSARYWQLTDQDEIKPSQGTEDYDGGIGIVGSPHIEEISDFSEYTSEYEYISDLDWSSDSSYDE